MIEENANDLLTYMSIDDFAEWITVGGVRIRAIYDGMYQQLFEGNTIISTTQPKIFCRTTDVATADVGTQVFVRNVQYEVADIQPDGTGFTTLLLHKVQL